MDYSYSFPGSSRYINKKLLIEAHQATLIQLGRKNSPFSWPFPRPSAVEKRWLKPKKNLSILQLMNYIDDEAIGKFFLCRVLVEPFKMVALHTIVEDPMGQHAIRLCLYDYDRDTLPVGTILAIKDPWLKTTMDGGLSIRVEDSCDVVVLDSDALKELKLDMHWKGELKPDDVDYKREGNEYFVANEYLKAVASYSLGIVTSNITQTRVELFSNRALAYLRLEQFDQALEDTNSALRIDPKFLKAHYRKVKALFGLNKYEEAWQFVSIVSVETFKNVRLSKGNRETLDQLVAEAKLNLNNSRSGNFKTNDLV